MSGRALSIKKAQYYVWYLGWKECRGLGGREFTEPIAKQMIARRRGEVLPKLTIEVSKKELKIVQLVDTKKGKIEKMKYPPVASADVTYAVQTLSPDEDVVACIYLGYNPTTQGAVHVHVYRCDSPETARLFVEHLNGLIALPEHVARAARIEQELVSKGQVVPRPGARGVEEEDEDDDGGAVFVAPVSASSPGNMGNGNIGVGVPANGVNKRQSPHGSMHSDPRGRMMPTRETDVTGLYGSQGVFRQTSQESAGKGPINENDYAKLDDETASQYDSLAQELQKKLGKRPLLLPPKDYDTINRARGNEFDKQLRVCKNELILGKPVGKNGEGQERLESTATDSARGDSENSQDGDLDTHSPHDPSPRSLKSSGRFSGGFFENSRDEDVDAELAGIPISDPAFFQPDRPFSPGPATQDLRSSYFPGNQMLPGYMANSPASTPRGPAPYGSPRGNGGHPGEQQQRGGGAKYSASNLGLAAAPPPAQAPLNRGGRSYDEGYTSLERGAVNPTNPHPGAHPHPHYAPTSPRDYNSQFDMSRVGAEYPPRAAPGYQTSGGGYRRLRRSEDAYEEPPIDYTIAVRKAPTRQSRPSFH